MDLSSESSTGARDSIPSPARATTSWIVGPMLAAALLGCGRQGKEAPKGGSEVPPSKVKLSRNVELSQVKQMKLASYVETVGYLDAEGQTDMAAGVTGVVDAVLFREGQYVDRDSVLVKVDQRRYLTALEVAKANEARAEAALGLAREMQRISSQAGIGSTAEDKVRTGGNQRVAESDLAAARAARALAEHFLDRSQVRAPYAGQINKRLVTPGTYLEEKTVIGTIADLSKLRLVGYIPEKSAPMIRTMIDQEERLRTGFVLGAAMASRWLGLYALASDSLGDGPAAYRIEFELRPFPRQTFHGRIFYMSSVASPDTHMFECKAEVPLRGDQGDLRPGYTAKIRCPLPGDALSYVVPEEAVRASERGFVAFRPKRASNKEGGADWVAEAVVLELGVRKPGFVEVLKGLAPGDWIVRKGAESLENNTPISFPEEQTPPY